jgi:hypothetical protein
MMSAPPFDLPYAIASSTSARYWGSCAAAKMSDGLVVASVGWNFWMLLKSPVSATTVVTALSCSSWFDMKEVDT